MATPAFAIVYTFDAVPADSNWTNGPNFPNNAGGPGNNWNGGQLAVPDGGTPSGNAIDYLYTGHDFNISNSTISEDVQIRLAGGSLTVNNSNISLLPSSATTTGQLSALNLGQNGSATTVNFTNSTLNVSRSNVGGRALGILNGSVTSFIGTTINTSAESGSGNIDVRQASSISLTGGSAINASGAFELFNTATMTIADSSVSATWFRADQNTDVTFQGGTVTVSDSNGIRGTLFDGGFNWTGAAGSGTFTHTNLSNNDTNLAGKVAQGFFGIDGVRINPTIANTTDWSNSANIDALNAELLTLAENGKYFRLTSSGGEQVLELLAVPEPSVSLLGGLSLLALLRRRR